MTFEEWWETKFEASQFSLTVDDMYKAFEAGWNSCAQSRSDMTYVEYLEEKQND